MFCSQASFGVDSEVLSVVSMMITVVGSLTQHGSVEVSRGFRVTYRFHLHARTARKQTT
jgi:hypothetical protein